MNQKINRAALMAFSGFLMSFTLEILLGRKDSYFWTSQMAFFVFALFGVVCTVIIAIVAALGHTVIHSKMNIFLEEEDSANSKPSLSESLIHCNIYLIAFCIVLIGFILLGKQGPMSFD